MPEHGGATRSGAPGVRLGAQRARVPVSGGGLRPHVRGPHGVRADGGRPRGGVRARGAIVLDRHDRRIFTPTPCGSPAWKRGYRRRTALERINARPDRSFEFEPPFLRGLSRARTRVGLALAVMMALASGQVRAGRPERMRSLYGPVPPAFAGAGFGPTPADRLAALPSVPVRSRGPRPVPAEAGGRLVRVARTGTFCPCTKARRGVYGSSSGSIAPRRTPSRARNDRPASTGQPRNPTAHMPRREPRALFASS